MKLKNAKHEAFCVNLEVKRMNQTEAYMDAGFSPKSARFNASVLRTKPNIRARIAELRKEAGDDCRWSKQRLLDWHVEVLETPIGGITPDHPLAQSHQAATEKIGAKITMPAKMDSARELAKMCGWNEPEQIDIDASDPILEIMRLARPKK